MKRWTRGREPIAKRATPSSADWQFFLAHDLGGGEKNGLALDTRDHSGDSLVARDGEFVHAGRLRAYPAGLGDRGGSDPRDPGTQTGLKLGLRSISLRRRRG